MLQKYKVMVFLDDDIEPPEYRKIVGLEWNVKKPKGWELPGVPGSSFPWRQWKVVGNLLPEKHQATIDELAAVADDAVDVNPALEAYFTNLAAAIELQVRKIDLRADVAMDADGGADGTVSDEDDDNSDDDDCDDDESSRRR